jgi:glycosyltransferase involved in cell wall biosynthesis
MANILFFTPYYPPEVGAAQTRISETAVRLVKRGHRVTILTTLPNYPLGKVPAEYRSRSQRRQVRDGVSIVRVWSYISPNKGFLRRILAQLSFGCLASFLGLRAVGKPDVIIVESPPLFDAIGGRLLARIKRCPYVFTVADIWPESAVQLGVLHNRFLIRLAEWLEWSTYRRAGAIWSVTAGIRQTLVERGLPEKQIFLLPNGVDTEKFRPRSQGEARAELGWGDGFTLIYAGTIGLAHGLNTLLDAAEQLKRYSDIRVVLIGEGAAKDDLMADVERRQLTNVTFLNAQPHDRMPSIIAAADACLVSLRKVPLFEGALPSKMYEAMACARPIVLAVDGEARQLIAEQAGAALYVEPESAPALAQAILHMRDQPELARQLGERGREFVKSHFDRNQLVVALEDRLLALMKRQQEEAQVHLPVLQESSDTH